MIRKYLHVHRVHTNSYTERPLAEEFWIQIITTIRISNVVCWSHFTKRSMIGTSTLREKNSGSDNDCNQDLLHSWPASFLCCSYGISKSEQASPNPLAATDGTASIPHGSTTLSTTADGSTSVPTREGLFSARARASLAKQSWDKQSVGEKEQEARCRDHHRASLALPPPSPFNTQSVEEICWLDAVEMDLDDVALQYQTQ